MLALALQKKMPKARVFGIILFAVLVVYLIRINSTPDKQELEFLGSTMGTVPYSVKVISAASVELKSSIDSVLVAFNQSLSTYIPDSEISIFNKTDSFAYESNLFYPILLKSAEIAQRTNGAFDPTIGPLVNLWGFGPDKVPVAPDSALVDSLMQYVGFDKINFSEEMVRKQPGVYFDLSAIAKGYAVDLVGEFLESKGLSSYLVEIGGEVRVRGKNLKEEPWSIGIDDPLVDKSERKILAIARLENRSLATSGNYRNYYEKDGQIIAHIIDPTTGYNKLGEILSASVFATDCMTADAYATAFMVMELEDTKEVLETENDLEAVIVYQKDGEVLRFVSDGIESQLTILDE